MRNCIYCFDCEWVAEDEEEVVVVGTGGGFGSITIKHWVGINGRKL